MQQFVPRPHIIIVEDDAAVLDSLQFALEEEGYAVDGFANAAGVLESAAVEHADCMVIDFSMPGMDGITLIHTLRGRRVTCPAIMIASNPTQRCRHAALAAGAPLVEKPLLGGDLLRQIHASLAQGPRAAVAGGMHGQR